MELQNKQKMVDEIINKNGGYWSPLSMLAQLVEDTGGLSREINSIYTKKKYEVNKRKEQIKNKIGDILITLFCITNSMNLNMESVYRDTINKINLDKRIKN